MSKRMASLVCGACSAVALLAGCGGSSHGSASVNTTSVAGLCPSVRSSLKQYETTTATMSIRFTDKFFEIPAREAAQALLVRVRQLERLSAPQQKLQLVPLFEALSNQVRTLEAFERNDPAEARKFGNSINAPLRQGLKDLKAICAAG